MKLDYILEELQTRGAQNREAIIAHRSSVAGIRGATGRFGKKRETAGIACPQPVAASSAGPPILPRMKFQGNPIKCTGPKPKGDGYNRDRITGVITRCSA